MNHKETRTQPTSATATKTLRLPVKHNQDQWGANTLKKYFTPHYCYPNIDDFKIKLVLVYIHLFKLKLMNTYCTGQVS